jgi:transposase-like protein
VDGDGYRRILGVSEGHKEDKAGWLGFLKGLKKRGLTGVRLMISDACLGLVESLAEVFPDADWKRCVVHFYRNVFSHVPRGKMREVAAMLKAIHAQESREAAENKSGDVVRKLKAMKLKAAAELIENSIHEKFSYFAYPPQHWLKIKTNNPMERLLKEARRRTKVVGAFPDGNSALMLVAARLRHVSSTAWGTRKYMNMNLLIEMDQEAIYSVA